MSDGFMNYTRSNPESGQKWVKYHTQVRGRKKKRNIGSIQLIFAEGFYYKELEDGTEAWDRMKYLLADYAGGKELHVKGLISFYHLGFHCFSPVITVWLTLADAYAVYNPMLVSGFINTRYDFKTLENKLSKLVILT
jgi:hypothetical protein